MLSRFGRSVAYKQVSSQGPGSSIKISILFIVRKPCLCFIMKADIFPSRLMSMMMLPGIDFSNIIKYHVTHQSVCWGMEHTPSRTRSNLLGPIHTKRRCLPSCPLTGTHSDYLDRIAASHHRQRYRHSPSLRSDRYGNESIKLAFSENETMRKLVPPSIFPTVLCSVELDWWDQDENHFHHVCSP